MRYYVFTDIHGMSKQFDHIVTYMESQGEDYQCFYLGDACDRGPDGFEIMNKLLDNPKIVYLKGNHEDMFVRACRAFYNMAAEEGYTPYEYAKAHSFSIINVPYDSDIGLCMHNGGIPTLDAWLQHGCPKDFMRRIQKLPLKAQVTIEDEKGNPVRTFDMCHAGCIEAEWDTDNEEAMLWDRTHFSAKWDPADNIPHVLIHGHTPTIYLSRYAYDAKYSECQECMPINYSNSTKIDLDTGAFFSGRAWLMDLTTLECFAFGPDGKEEE